MLERFFIAIPARSGRYPSGQRGQTVNLLAYAFGGSNPPLPTIVATASRAARVVGGLSEVRGAPTRPIRHLAAIVEVRGAPAPAIAGRVAMVEGSAGGNSSAVERQPSKLGVAGSNPVSRSTRIRRAHGLAGGEERWGFGGHVGALMTIDGPM